VCEFRPVAAGGGGRKIATAAGEATGSWSPSVEDAMGFVQMVKEAFKDRHPDKYHLFLSVLDDFRNQRVGIAEVASTAKELFHDSPTLALGFNVFLPKGHRIQVGLDELAACFIRDMNLDDDDEDDAVGAN